jgi:hypothetical protein
VAEVDVVLFESGLFPVTVRWVDLLPRVSLPVLPGVVLRRVPWLVRVPGVHVEEELLVVVALQPPLGLSDGAGDHPVLLGTPGRPRVGALVRPGVVALAPDPDEVVESTVIPKPVADEERRVHDTHGVVAGSGESNWQRRQVPRQWLPTHVRVRKRSRQHVGPRRHSGERRDDVPVENHGRSRELVYVRRADVWVPISPKVVPAERVSHDHHHVRTLPLQRASPTTFKPTTPATMSASDAIFIWSPAP